MTHGSTRRRFVVGIGATGAACLTGCASGGTGGPGGATSEMDDVGTETGMGDRTATRVRVENVSTAETLQTSAGPKPGVGPNRAPRQSGPNAGPDEDGAVQRVAAVDGFGNPAASAGGRVTVTPDAMEVQSVGCRP